jgi:uncharacterized membrane protein (Fun14 family)
MANVERGFRRLTLVISVVILMVGLFIVSRMYIGSTGSSLINNTTDLVESFALLLCIAAIPWGLFYILRWVARGFYR